MIVVTLPLRVVSVANLREHWSKRAKRSAEHRGLATLALRSPVNELGWQLAPRSHAGRKRRSRANLEPPSAIYAVTLTRLAPCALDDDNLRGALKAVRDGVADALGIDDRDPRVAWRYGQRRAGVREYGVEIRISAELSCASAG